ncbi:LETM1 domain-containing protein 1-like [Antedon mediterranea]|uniref:LETM1 domain-containing protein 1-like n=1 Tax=Antedon mediterranea TaxID=105859 RepID=UPI003AF4E5D1
MSCFCTTTSLLRANKSAYLSLQYGFLESKNVNLNLICLKNKLNTLGFCTTSQYNARENEKHDSTGLLRVYKKYEQKYFDYIRERFPRYYKVNMQVIGGAKTTWHDTKYRLHLRKKMKENKISYLDLPWKDIVFIRQYRRDLYKVTPTLVLCLFPVVFYAVLVIVALRPRLLLSQQFFTAEQQNKYRVNDQKRRVKSYPQVVKHLKNSQCRTKAEKEMLDIIITRIEQGKATVAHDLINSRNLFEESLDVANLQKKQLVDICKLLSINPYLQPSFFLRRRLVFSLTELQTIDKGIKRDNDLHKLDLVQLQRICFDRGFYSMDGLTDQVFRNWLQNWIELSTNVSENKMTLSGYAAFLLVINHPANGNSFAMKKK